MKDNNRKEKRKFKLYEHPWLSMLAVMVTSVFSMFLTGTVIFGRIGLPDDSPAVLFCASQKGKALFGSTWTTSG